MQPDVVTLAKGLGGGVPIGALVTFGAASTMFEAGQHGSTFGGNPLACAAGVAVMRTIEDERLREQARRLGEHLVAAVENLDDERVVTVRGRGLLRGIVLRDPLAQRVVVRAREAGFIINATGPDVIRLAPPLVITGEQIDTFVAALPGLLDAAETEENAS